MSQYLLSMADLMKNTPQETEDTKKLRRWKSEFALDFKHHEVWANKKRQWEKFYDGDQLSTDEKQALAARGQPEVVINRIAPRVDSVIGDFLSRRVMMRARDRGTGDFEKARYITEALRYVEDQNRFDEQEALTVKNLCIGGQGWYKIHLEFDFLEPEVKISHRSYNDIILDRRWRRIDMKDAKRLWEHVWVEIDDLIELYPDFKQEIESSVEMVGEGFTGPSHPGQTWTGDDYAISDNVSADTNDLEVFLDKGRKRIRLINVWERVQKRIEFAFHPGLDGGVVELTKMDKQEISDFHAIYKGAQVFTRYRWELNSGIFIANKILEETLDVRPHDSDGKFPFARALGKVEHETNLPYGMVKQYIDAQKEYNKRRSKLLHKTNTNQIIMEEGAVIDVERARKEAAKPDGVLVVKPGKRFEINNDDPNQTDVFMLQLSSGEIEEVGVAKEFMGNENKVMSGSAIEKRQIASDKMIRPFYAALRAARRDAFGIALEEMQQFWTSQKLVSITDDENAKGIVLNQRVENQMTGEVEIINNLRLGKYDIKIDEDIETPNVRNENFNQLVQLAPAIVQSGQPFPIEALIGASDMPGKQDLIAMITAEKQRQMEIAQANAMTAQAQAVAAHAGAAQNGQNVSPNVTGG